MLDTLRAIVGEHGILSSAHDLEGFVEDWRGRYRGDALCVVLPRNTGEVSAVVRAAVAAGVPVLPQGGNTSLSGGSVPFEGEGAVILNLSRMRRIRHVDAANHSMEVEAGCVLADIQAAAVAAHRFFPISLGAEGSCQIGGNIATNAGGTGVLRYGNTRENVLGLEVVLPDGTVWNGLRTLRKDNTGLDLKHLFIGAEGTLGIITAATLKLSPLPTAHAVSWLAPASVEAALELLGLFQERCGAQLSAFELMNRKQLDIVLAHVPGQHSPLAEPHAWHLLVELSDSDDEARLGEALENTLAVAFDRGLVTDAVLASSSAQREALWKIRHSVSEGNKKAGVGLTLDTAVPVSQVPEFIARATAAIKAAFPADVVIVGHMGDGNIHFIPFFDFATWEAQTNRDALTMRVKRVGHDIAASLGGTFSAEHGVGRTLLGEMQHYKSDVEIAMLRAVKRAFDPQGLFNPGKLIP
ncbi:FAD-binding oxidoreductase [Pandoraea terrae]